MSSIVDDPMELPPAPASPSTPPHVIEDNLEVEVKFLVEDLKPVRDRLLASGASLGTPRIHEVNIRFDTRDDSLLRRYELLRLRQDSRARLTFKGPAAQDRESEAKVREEIEVEVADFGRLALILERLGFQPVQTYEKYRETFHWGAVEVVLDELPFGYFVELEGSESGIKEAARKLGLDWSRRVLANYLTLMELARRTFDLPFFDLTFDNFNRSPVDMRQLLPVCVLPEMDD